jgi:predicted PurR-regulated permease PerM
MDTIIPSHAQGSTRPQRFAIGALSIAALALGVYTLWNFLSALVWAGIFAIALGPLYEHAVARFGTGKHNVLLPAAFTLAVALIFIAPVGVIGMQVGEDVHAATQWAINAERNGIPEPDLLHHLPFGQAQVDGWWQENLTDPGSARELVQRVTRGRVSDVSREIGRQLIRRLTLFVFTLLTLFFLFKERQHLSEQLRIASGRAFGPDGARLGRQLFASIHGTVDGLVLVGLGEGLLLGILYGIAGVPHATIFGVLTAVAAMIPFAAPVIFGLAALILIAQGSLAWGIAVICIGFAITFAADHFVRPVLIGGATKLPFIWVLLGILGGVEAWGLLGLFVGPAIMSILIMLWREWACGKRGAA